MFRHSFVKLFYHIQTFCNLIFLSPDTKLFGKCCTRVVHSWLLLSCGDFISTVPSHTVTWPSPLPTSTDGNGLVHGTCCLIPTRNTLSFLVTYQRVFYFSRLSSSCKMPERTGNWTKKKDKADRAVYHYCTEASVRLDTSLMRQDFWDCLGRKKTVASGEDRLFFCFRLY